MNNHMPDLMRELGPKVDGMNFKWTTSYHEGEIEYSIRHVFKGVLKDDYLKIQDRGQGRILYYHHLDENDFLEKISIRRTTLGPVIEIRSRSYS